MKRDEKSKNRCQDASFDAYAKLYLQNCYPWDIWLFGACENVKLVDSQTARYSNLVRMFGC